MWSVIGGCKGRERRGGEGRGGEGKGKGGGGGEFGMGEVILHVYDVTNSMNVQANSVIMNINKIMRDGIGIGGIFHSAVQVRFPSSI